MVLSEKYKGIYRILHSLGMDHCFSCLGHGMEQIQLNVAGLVLFGLTRLIRSYFQIKCQRPFQCRCIQYWIWTVYLCSLRKNLTAWIHWSTDWKSSMIWPMPYGVQHKCHIPPAGVHIDQSSAAHAGASFMARPLKWICGSKSGQIQNFLAGSDQDPE